MPSNLGSRLIFVESLKGFQNSEYDQEIPQSQTADKLMAPRFSFKGPKLQKRKAMVRIFAFCRSSKVG